MAPLVMGAVLIGGDLQYLCCHPDVSRQACMPLRLSTSFLGGKDLLYLLASASREVLSSWPLLCRGYFQLNAGAHVLLLDSLLSAQTFFMLTDHVIPILTFLSCRRGTCQLSALGRLVCAG